MKSPLRNLLGARYAAQRNRLKHQSKTWWLSVGAGVVALVAVWIGLGHAAAPSLVVPPIDIATPRGLAPEELPAGSAAMEAAFWLTILIASVLNFRVMELLFRRQDMRAVEFYPLPLSTLFVDRLIAGFAESLGAALFCALFFVPLLWHGAPWAALLSAGVIVVGLIATTAIAFAVLLVSGASQAGPPPAPGSPKKPRSSGDMYGGSGQVFLYAPGVALGISVLSILFIKLVLGEALQAEALNRIALWGLGIVGGLTALCIYLAYRDFTRSFPAMAARFREADIIGFDIDLPYQKSTFQRPALMEGVLDGNAVYMLRAHILQYGRRYMMGRYVYVLGWLAGAWALWSLSPAAFPAWIAAILPTIVLAMLANPWRRIANYHRKAIHTLALPISRHEDQAAQIFFTTREAKLLAMPYALLVLAIRGGVHGLWLEAALIAAVALMAPIAISAAMGWSERLFGSSAVLDLAIPLVVTLGFAALAALSLEALLPLVLVIHLTQWILWKKPHDPHAVAT